MLRKLHSPKQIIIMLLKKKPHNILYPYCRNQIQLQEGWLSFLVFYRILHKLPFSFTSLGILQNLLFVLTVNRILCKNFLFRLKTIYFLPRLLTEFSTFCLRQWKAASSCTTKFTQNQTSSVSVRLQVMSINHWTQSF